MSGREDEQAAPPAAPAESAHTAPSPVGVARFWPVVSGAAALALVVMLALVIFYRETDKPFGFEIEFMAGMVANRAEWLTVPALVFNAVGGGILSNLVVPAVVIVGLLLFRRPWGAIYYVTAAIASAGVTRLIKVLVGRERPEDILVNPDFGSFPSGHTANAATIAVVLYLLFPRVWVAVAGISWTVAMALSRTLLSVHWASDTLGGALVGTSVALLLAAWALPWARTLTEGRPRRRQTRAPTR